MSIFIVHVENLSPSFIIKMKEISKSGEGPAFGANARQCIYTAWPCYS